MNRQSPVSLLLATDRLASPLLEAGAASARAAYTPYGYRPGGMQGRTGFTGQLREAELGWYMLGNGHRVYNPLLMRFHSPDRLSPFGAGGLNGYAYCAGDPVNFTDPKGMTLQTALSGMISSGTALLYGKRFANKAKSKGTRVVHDSESLYFVATTVGGGIGAAGSGLSLAGMSGPLVDGMTNAGLAASGFAVGLDAYMEFSKSPAPSEVVGISYQQLQGVDNGGFIAIDMEDSVSGSSAPSTPSLGRSRSNSVVTSSSESGSEDGYDASGSSDAESQVSLDEVLFVGDLNLADLNLGLRRRR